MSWEMSVKTIVSKVVHVTTTRDYWLLTLAACFSTVSLICIVLSIMALAKAKWMFDHSAAQPLALLIVGLALICATISMLHYIKWGRNIATSLAVSICWALASAASNKLGYGYFAFKMPAILLASASLSYFTGPPGRLAFNGKDRGRSQVTEE